jgi:hypothetical protein
MSPILSRACQQAVFGVFPQPSNGLKRTVSDNDKVDLARRGRPAHNRMS